MKKLIYFLLLLISVSAEAQQTDTTKKISIADTLKKDLLTAPDTVPHLRSKSWTLIPPAVLVGYGITSFYAKPLRRLDRYIYKEANEHDIITTSHLENYFQYAPVALTYGLNLVGVHGKNTFVDRTFIYLLSQGMLQLTTFTVKRSTHRLRPNGANRYSFPSGHTANAFAGAEFMAQELSGKSEWYGALGYAFATTTGIFRIYHQDHWFSDVIAGAGCGILATKGAYLLYPVIRNRLTRAGRQKEKNRDIPPELQKKKQPKNTLLLPTYQGGTVGLSFAMEL
ncbi:phosphatase PAP2 family protein [Mucilaginibacter sp. KACC 22063]|uniref:phosphatase PAP2 family protein n=1 Tax=Mucilaginibacter sp. KACC 22063 TaxID=3025666 RepID=UPI002365E40A|nr:phosphatase PAP2 family protein [Mucilaginibacter sp. KACC 22063]WDF53873.1 phosphatase PAP2 family protein [Mucilaginibacter sp. KACC 22063]